ncbi:hypothetical protein D3OALGA1CA_1420 [Olavius algarvensis associated proteobacterium Delta 3]|nr:hypothetical protein D3OALGA1CA_1420 [Olavius algarvensis associated proteobacterium Delta 3]
MGSLTEPFQWGYWILDTGYWKPDTGFWMRDELKELRAER